MRINLEDGRYVNVEIRKNDKEAYEYYINGILVGIYDIDAMRDSKFLTMDLEKNNTLANELSAESKDELKQVIKQVKEHIEQVKINDIKQEAKDNEALDGYMREIGLDRRTVKSITTMNLEKEKEKLKEKQEKSQTTEKNNLQQPKAKTMTKKDVNIKQEVGLEERATDVQDLKRFLLRIS